MHSVRRSPGRQRQFANQCLNEKLRVILRVQEWNAFEELKTPHRRIGVAGAGLVNDQLRNEQFKSMATCVPSHESGLLARGHDKLGTTPCREITRNHRFKVDGRHEPQSSFTASWPIPAIKRWPSIPLRSRVSDYRRAHRRAPGYKAVGLTATQLRKTPRWKCYAQGGAQPRSS